MKLLFVMKFLFYLICLSVSYCIVFGIYFGKDAAIGIFTDTGIILTLIFLAAFSALPELWKDWINTLSKPDN